MERRCPTKSPVEYMSYSALFQEFAAAANSPYSERQNLDFLHDFPLHRKQRSAPVAEAAGPDESPAGLNTQRYTYNREGTIEMPKRTLACCEISAQKRSVPR
jgi:hypothetical protein